MAHNRRCLFQVQLVLPQLLVLFAETLQFVGFRLVKPCIRFRFNPMANRRFAGFIVVGQRSNRTSLSLFEDDPFAEG